MINPLLKLTAIGGLPDAVRKRFGIPWRVDEEAEYRVLQLAVQQTWRLIPRPLRYGPVASAARRAAAAAA